MRAVVRDAVRAGSELWGLHTLSPPDSMYFDLVRRTLLGSYSGVGMDVSFYCFGKNMLCRPYSLK